jgi:hypothetical protein
MYVPYTVQLSSTTYITLHTAVQRCSLNFSFEIKRFLQLQHFSKLPSVYKRLEKKTANEKVTGYVTVIRRKCDTNPKRYSTERPRILK